MKKSVLIILSLFISFTAFFISIVLNVNAASAFTLSNGQFENVSGESEEYRIIAQDLFTALTINVSESGEVSGEEQAPFSFELNGDSYSGRSSIKLKGVYDFKKHTVTGTFTYKHNRLKKHTFTSGNIAELNGSRNIANDKFSGTIENDSTQIQFMRIGAVTYTGASPEENEKENVDTSDLPDVEYQPGVDTGARFSGIQGEVKIFPDGNPNEITFARDTTKIEPGTHIFTGEESSVTLVFADLSTYKLPPNSEIVIKSFNSKSNISLITGGLWTNIKKMVNGESIEVRTNQAVTGIKGTTFVLEASADKTTLKMIEGAVSFTSIGSGKTETVKTGETITATSKELEQKAVFNPAEEEKKWKELMVNKKNTNKFIGWFNLFINWIKNLFVN